MNMHKHLTLRMFTVVYRVICNCEKLEKTQKLNDKRFNKINLGNPYNLNKCGH